MEKEIITEAAELLSVLRDPEKATVKRPFVALPPGYIVHDVEKFMEQPIRAKANHVFVSADSFLEYVKKFTTGESPFVTAAVNLTSDTPLVLCCTIDYHDKKQDMTAARWGQHVVYLDLRYDPDFAKWMSGDNKLMEQAAFAEHVEEFTHVFVTPDGATMLEIAQHLQGARSVNWVSGKRINNGQAHFEYAEEISAKTKNGTVDVPEKFVIKMPVFSHMGEEEITAMLRWRLHDGKLLFGYKLVQVRKIVDKVVKQIADRVESETALKVHYIKSASR